MSNADIREQAQNVEEPAAYGQAQVNQRKKRKARLRSARRVAFATACLLIGICVYSVLDPAILGTTSSFIGRAKLWVGNILQVNAAVDAPPPDTGFYSIETPVTNYDLKTVEEISATFGITVYEPTQIPGSMKLGNVEAEILDGELIVVRYHYTADENSKVVFSIQPILGEQQFEPQWNFPDDAFKHMTPAGEFTIFCAQSGWWYSKMLTSKAIVDINGKLDKDTFLNMLDSLRAVN